MNGGQESKKTQKPERFQMTLQLNYEDNKDPLETYSIPKEEK